MPQSQNSANISREDKGSSSPPSNVASTEHTLQPFFILVRDLTTSDYHHPHTHYVFEDDDPEVLTAAVVDGLEAASDAEPSADSERYVLVDMSDDGLSVKAVRTLSAQWQPTAVRLTSAPTFDHKASQTNVMMAIEGRTASSLPPESRHQADLSNLQGSAELDRVSKLTAHLETLASEYDREMFLLADFTDSSTRPLHSD